MFALIHYFVEEKARMLRARKIPAALGKKLVYETLLFAFFTSILVQAYFSATHTKCIGKVGNDISRGRLQTTPHGCSVASPECDIGKTAIICEDAQQTATTMCYLVAVGSLVQTLVIPFQKKFTWASVVRFDFEPHHQMTLIIMSLMIILSLFVYATSNLFEYELKQVRNKRPPLRLSR